MYRSLKALWTYLKKRDVDVVDIMEKIKDLIIKTIIRFVLLTTAEEFEIIDIQI